MDYGAVVNGYHSDMTRTICIGKADETQKKLYDTVLQAQLAALDADTAGVGGLAGAVDEHCVFDQNIHSEILIKDKFSLLVRVTGRWPRS